jgi:hypothetical protein
MIRFPHFLFKKGLSAILLCSGAYTAIAQTDSVYRQLPAAREKVPLYIINSDIIGGGGSINVSNIKAINVLKGNVPDLARYKNLDKYGVIIFILKDSVKVEAKSFNDIKLWLNMKGEVDFAVDGFFIENKNLRIATADINEINVIKKDQQNKLLNNVINVWTIPPGSRKGEAPHSNPGKPGEIYIR